MIVLSKVGTTTVTDKTAYFLIQICDAYITYLRVKPDEPSSHCYNKSPFCVVYVVPVLCRLSGLCSLVHTQL